MIPATREADRRRADEQLIATLAVGALAVGGVAVLARSPRLRRLAWLGARFALTTWLPAWGMTQLRAAWTDAAPDETVPAFAPPMDADRG